MPTVQFNLNSDSSETSVIMLFFYYDNYRLKMSMGKSILTKHWNNKKLRVREQMELPEYADINLELNELSNLVPRIYNDHRN